MIKVESEDTQFIEAARWSATTRKGFVMLRTHFKVCVSLIALSLVFIRPAAADPGGPLHLSVYGGEIWPEEDNFDESTTIGGRFTLDVIENLEIGLDVSWRQADNDFNNVKIGEATEVPVLAIAKYRLDFDETYDPQVIPYIIGGVGISYWNFDKEFDTIDADDDASFAAMAGLGVDVYLTGNTSLFVEGAYSWSEYDIDGSVNSLSVDDAARMDGVVAKAGVTLSL